MTGSVSVSDSSGNERFSYECVGEPTCVGSQKDEGTIVSAGCPDFPYSVSDVLTITGLNLAQPGSLQGTITLVSEDLSIDSQGCITAITNTGLVTYPYTGTWDGTKGELGIVFEGSVVLSLPFTATRSSSPPPPPVFPMTVTGGITNGVANVQAQIQFRPEDVGKTGAVYVFALAPSTIVKNAATTKDSRLGWKASGALQDTPVPCVLAQLNLSGQLQAVSASSLQAYVSGVLSSQGQAVTVLDGVPAAPIAGATFYVGYGPNSTEMINSGVNRSAITVPGSITCQPQAPQTGWWWNTTEGGRGYSIEVAGHHVFFASYLYDVSGRATWLVASGNTSLDGSLFTGQLESYAQGQALPAAYKAPNFAGYVGAITLAFSDASHGTLSWPGGTIAIERFNIVPNGLSMAPRANQPESGWWWNPGESGRGFFLEWQGGELFMAGYMYDANGNPIWYLSANSTPSTNLQSYSNNWLQFGNGQTLTGTYRPAVQVNGNVAPVTITFQDAQNAIMTLPGGRTTAITRFRF